jgi:predicted nuclease of predicted toxin-antitoxin system
VRFLADMGVSSRTVAWLCGLGHDAVHVRERAMQRAPDAEILAKAAAEERMVLTMDLDFGYLLAAGGVQRPSVILFRLSDERAEFVNSRLSEVLLRCQDALESGAIVSVGDVSIRVRRLPV